MDFALPEYIRHRDNKRLEHIPGSYGLPVLGNTFRFILKPYEVLDENYQKYGPVCKASLTFQKFVVALGPEFIQLVSKGGDADEMTGQVTPRLPLLINPGETAGITVSFLPQDTPVQLQVDADLWEISGLP